MPNMKSRTDRRTRDHLRQSNSNLRRAIREFVLVQEQIFRDFYDTDAEKFVPADWKRAYRKLKELMASENKASGSPEGPARDGNAASDQPSERDCDPSCRPGDPEEAGVSSPSAREEMPILDTFNQRGNIPYAGERSSEASNGRVADAFNDGFKQGYRRGTGLDADPPTDYPHHSSGALDALQIVAVDRDIWKKRAENAQAALKHLEQTLAAQRPETAVPLPKGTCVRILNGGGRGVVERCVYVIRSDQGGHVQELFDNVRALPTGSEDPPEWEYNNDPTGVPSPKRSAS